MYQCARQLLITALVVRMASYPPLKVAQKHRRDSIDRNMVCFGG